jgi:hypothetical protein
MLRASLEDLLPKLTAERPFQSVLEHGDASAVVYAPRGVDQQYAHDQAEVYVIARGRGRFINGPRTIDFAPGDLLFVDVAVQHRFIEFTSDFVVWAVFFGPSILGRYRFSASTAEGPVHSGEVSIEQKQGDTTTRGEDVFHAIWRPATGPILNGLGFGRERHIAFARAPGDEIRQTGLVEYRLEDGRLQARWAHHAYGAMIGRGVGTREGTPQNQFIGQYTIQYTDDAGNPAFSPFTLQIEGEGQVRRLRWDSPGTMLAGIGIETDGMLVAAWGPVGLDLGLVDYVSPLSGNPMLAGRTVQTDGKTIDVENVSLIPLPP